MILSLIIAASLSVLPAAAHLAPFHPSMYGFNWTTLHISTSYDNRPVAPLMGLTFSEWWMHGHMDLPPNPGDFLELPAGGNFQVQMACDKSATDYWNTSGQADFRDGEWPCPGASSVEFHTKDITDTKGCAFGIAYKSDIYSVTPNDITIFTVNYTCPWYRTQWFEVPADLPPCDDCICTFNWIHSPDSGSQQIYQNGYKCKVLNDGPGKQLQTPQLARRCGPDPYLNRPANASNCTGGVEGGAKLGMYWLQADGNNMFEDYYHPPLYDDLYGFMDGAQTDIFVRDGAAPTTTTASSSTMGVGSATTSTATTSGSFSSSSSSSSVATSSVSGTSGSSTSTVSSTTTSSTPTSSVAAPAGAGVSAPTPHTQPSSNTCGTMRKRTLSSRNNTKPSKRDGKKKLSSKRSKRAAGERAKRHSRREGKKRHAKIH
ncbi:hypothetical protein DACRYDRAFT_63002 [Dacryopinax primogenitus]|uniref:Lytic polysaccharide monooxygenase n=1 Tax=Dacryopinax primogenitus (strain DJM 731) TaxID=1858805 RepID=M5GDS9_DACPD|nr:uncharacterized protein DACRYDRAFT_63002 [Dacryopinax primogenitus]EJU04797.1 hypothetical protein DACRYDRAFT_63002 [Dacryopinax primogenitus]